MFVENILFLVVGLAAGFVTGWSLKKTSDDFSTKDEEVMSEAREAVAERTQKRLDRVMEVAEREGRITNDGVEELFCISNRTAYNYLSKLVDTGKLEKVGEGRGTYYQPKI